MGRPTIEELWIELHEGKVWECSLRDPKWHLDGLQQGNIVYIDPRPSILETLLHELTHRLRPDLSEIQVDASSKRLMRQMTQQEMARWYRAYRKIAKKGRPVNTED